MSDHTYIGTSAPEHTAHLRQAYDEGVASGANAASWIEIDTAEEARAILQGIEDGDPAIMEMQPNPLSGEWAGTSPLVVMGGLLGHDEWREMDGDLQTHLMDTFEEAFSEGFWDALTRAAQNQL